VCATEGERAFSRLRHVATDESRDASILAMRRDHPHDAIDELPRDTTKFRLLFSRATQLFADGDRARAELLSGVHARLDPDRALRLIEDVFRHGDAPEQIAVVRALGAFPNGERFVPLARRASRTHVVPVFEALACDNPYPAAYLPNDAFAQLVMKAVFLGLPLSRVLGLRARIEPELARMAADFAAERRAANRPVPDDLHLLQPEVRA
jgi:hypothetical protein